MKVEELLMLVCLGGMFSCTPMSKPSYTLVGKVDSVYNGKVVYLKNHDDASFVDSTFVSDGTFKFIGRQDTAAFCYLTFGKETVNLILENDSILLEENGSGWVAKGTLLNDDRNAYKAKSAGLQSELVQKQGKIRENKDLTDEERKAAYKKVWNEYKTSQLKEGLGFFNRNKNNVLAIFVTQDLWTLLPPQELLDSVKRVAGHVRELDRMKEFETSLEALVKTQPGNMFVDFVTRDNSGKESKLSDYVGKGKYVLVDFWASWCAPCRWEMPNLAKIYNKYAKNGKMIVLGVATWDEEAKTRKAMEELNVVWPQMFNAGDLPMSHYGIRGIPHIILFDPEGKIVKRELRGESMMTEIDDLMK